ncbi:MAG: hypothetical protein COS15_02355 [Caldiserica bacterium CG02_land_8_20_14_3_00_36_38]|nr:MAG: hypothetical protein COS15_02355 [Caldiserica bacterium CG02_land_8_20_14_3_00_36_38]
MKNYESPTIEQAGGSDVQGTFLYHETTVWNTNNSTVDTTYLIFSHLALAVYIFEVAVLLLSNPPEEG